MFRHGDYDEDPEASGTLTPRLSLEPQSSGFPHAQDVDLPTFPSPTFMDSLRLNSYRNSSYKSTTAESVPHLTPRRSCSLSLRHSRTGHTPQNSAPTSPLEVYAAFMPTLVENTSHRSFSSRSVSSQLISGTAEDRIAIVDRDYDEDVEEQEQEQADDGGEDQTYVSIRDDTTYTRATPISPMPALMEYPSHRSIRASPSTQRSVSSLLNKSPHYRA